jgi:Fe2+ transport system protein FeoA
MEICLCELKQGQEGLLLRPPEEGKIGERLSQFGLIHQTPLRCRRASLRGGPMILRVRGTDLVLRKELCQRLRVWVQ